MSIEFNPKSKSVVFFNENNDSLAELKIHSHKRFIFILKILGIVEDISCEGKIIHANRSYLIKEYRREFKPQGLSDKDILRIIRACFKDSKRDATSEQELETSVNSDSVKIKPFEGVITEGPLKGIKAKTDLESTLPKEADHVRAEKIIDTIALAMKSNLLDDVELHAALQNQYQMLKLIDVDGKWIDALQGIETELLPTEENIRKACEDLIDQMANAIKENPYFLNCIASIPDPALKKFQDKLSSENGEKLIHYLVPYAFALNGLTKAFTSDVDVFIKVDRKWAKEKPFNVRKYLPLFGWIKYTTLGRLSRAKKPLKTHETHKKSNRSYLNLNIFEAVMADKFFTRNKDNALAGEALMRHRVGGKENPRTGAGPTTVGVTKKGDHTYESVKIRPDLPKEWADLYTVWNFAFCSSAKTFPVVVMKLLIPAVNDYASDPQAYMNHRVIALYLHFQFSIFRQMAGQHHDFLSDDWNSIEITRAFGAANLQSANEYEAKVKQAKSADSSKIL